MIRKCRYKLNILSYAESGFGFRESVNSEKHFSSKSLDLHLPRFHVPFCISHILVYLFYLCPSLGISQGHKQMSNTVIRTPTLGRRKKGAGHNAQEDKGAKCLSSAI